MLKLDHIKKTFNPGTVNEKAAIRDLSLHLEPGDFATVIGSNGAGKSTMFAAIAGSFITDSGSITLNGKDITFAPEYQRSRVIGRLFQDPLKGTAPHMTIEENLSLAYLRASRGSIPFSRISKKDKEFFREQLSMLDMGLEDRMKQPVGLLSGGQRQAVALARALVRDPDILILDEPTSNMDNASEQMIKNRLKAVMGNKTLVLITHRLSMLELVDRLIVMEGGRIIADGPKNEVLRRLREQPAPRTEQ